MHTDINEFRNIICFNICISKALNSIVKSYCLMVFQALKLNKTEDSY